MQFSKSISKCYATSKFKYSCVINIKAELKKRLLLLIVSMLIVNIKVNLSKLIEHKCFFENMNLIFFTKYYIVFLRTSFLKPLYSGNP